jgi:hypothetical protein
MKITAFYDVASCSLDEADWRFRSARFLHHQGSTQLWNVDLLHRDYIYGAIYQKAVMRKTLQDWAFRLLLLFIIIEQTIEK